MILALGVDFNRVHVVVTIGSPLSFFKDKIILICVKVSIKILNPEFKWSLDILTNKVLKQMTVVKK